MKRKYPKLLDISLYIGLTTSIVVSFLFVIWIGSLYFFAINAFPIIFAGAIWSMTLYYVCPIGIIMLLVYIIANIRRLHIKILSAATAFLINIPMFFVLGFVIESTFEKVFIKITNHSGLNLVLNLNGESNNVDIGNLDNQSSEIFNFTPKHIIEEDYFTDIEYKFHLIIQHETGKDTIYFPTLKMGRCYHFEIDKNLNIHTTYSSELTD